MSSNISKLLFPTVVGITLYILVNKFFPEKVDSLEKDPVKNLRAGSRVNLFWRLLERFQNDKALKIALVGVVAAAGAQYFNSEIESLLIQDVFNQVCTKNQTGDLKVICDIVQDHDLNLHTQSMKSLIVS